ncbi:HVO_0649 family zinc finger protein [Haloferax sp. DFSO60]|uniref:HVO_0649 family zinc finger protein n=1 Tax=Haloferax sp. DFSO60 TaxID=3388652 RepID=UPI00397B89B2
MSIRRAPRGTTALDRLREHYTDAERVCRQCGYEDLDGQWSARTTGDRVLYRHICPSCGAIETRTLMLK